MLSLLFFVLFGAEALTEPPLEPPELESRSELPLLEVDSAPPSPEVAAELPLFEPGTEFLSSEPGLGWVLFQTLLVLAGVALLAYILLNWGGKYLLKWKDIGGQRAISIVERVSVDARKSLLLVKVANDYFLLSSGEKALTVLSKLNTEDVELALGNNKPTHKPGLFLKKLLEKKTTQKPPSEGAL